MRPIESLDLRSLSAKRLRKLAEHFFANDLGLKAADDALFDDLETLCNDLPPAVAEGFKSRLKEWVAHTDSIKLASGIETRRIAGLRIDPSLEQQLEQRKRDAETYRAARERNERSHGHDLPTFGDQPGTA